MKRARGWVGYPFFFGAMSSYQAAANGVVTVLGKGVNGTLFDYEAIVAIYTAYSFGVGAGLVSEIKTIVISADEMSNPRLKQLLIAYQTNNSNVSSSNFYVDVVNTCRNPVFLVSRNSLGMVQGWLFETSQTISFIDKAGRSSKRMKLITEGLTQDQFEGLNDLFAITETYETNESPQALDGRGNFISTTKTVYMMTYSINATEKHQYIKVKVVGNKNDASNKRNWLVFEMEIETSAI